MPVLMADELRRLMGQLLEVAGTPAGPAAVVGDSLVDANLAGHDSHGVIRIIQYLEEIEKGGLDPGAAPVVLQTSGATAIIDGHWGWGQPAMLLATKTAIALAGQYGLGMAAVSNCYHIGRVAPYVESIARAGMVGLAMANAGGAVAPYGGSSRVMGTNPFAWAAPRGGDRAPVSLDIATAYIAEGKLRVARAKGVEVPPGAVIDVDGKPSVDPNDFYDGGALVAFGAHKGSGLSILAQLLGAGLAQLTQENLVNRRGANGPVVLAIDVTRFAPLQQFTSVVENEAARVKASQVAAGFDEVLLPGEPELLRRAARERDGIDVPQRVWDELAAIVAARGIWE